MKQIIMAVFIFACGMKPVFPPLNCPDGEAVCVCDSNGDCEWNWICPKSL